MIPGNILIYTSENANTSTCAYLRHEVVSVSDIPNQPKLQKIIVSVADPLAVFEQANIDIGVSGVFKIFHLSHFWNMIRLSHHQIQVI